MIHFIPRQGQILCIELCIKLKIIQDKCPNTTVHEARKQQLKQPQTLILFWPSNTLAITVKSSEGLSFDEQMTLC